MPADTPELPGMPQAAPSRAPRKGSKAWVAYEVKRFYQLAKEHGGLMPAPMAAAALGVSRIRVYQLAEAGRIEAFEIMGKLYFAGDSVAERASADLPTGRPPKQLAEAA